MSGLEELAGQVDNVAEQVNFGPAQLTKENMTTIQTTLMALIGNTQHMSRLEGPITLVNDAADKLIEGLGALQEAIRGTAGAIVAGGT